MSSSAAVGSHFLNRNLFICDNLHLLRNLDNESVDLVCTDPPFAKNQTFKGKIRPPLKDTEIAAEKQLLSDWGIRSRNDAETAGILWPYDQKYNDAWFKDIWRYKKVVHEDWINQIADDWKAVSHILEAALKCKGENMAAYLTYMAVRIIEINRVLKPTGTFFLHCDHTASHYLKAVIDAVFGAKQFRNEIVWQRAGGRAKGSQHDPKSFGNDCDSILFYGKSDEAKFNGCYRQLSDEELHKKFPERDHRGRYNTTTPLFNQPSMNERPNLCYEYNGVENPHPSGWRVSKEKLKEMDKRGEIIWRDGKTPLRKSYLEDYKGKPIGNLWSDIQNLIGEEEKTGYPTQKPVVLAERIILAATDEGDVVLDPFAGCAYVPVAAERNRRQWIACDISIRALTVLRRQFAKFAYSVDGKTSDSQLEGLSIVQTFTRSPKDLPKRTDKDPKQTPKIKPMPKREYKVPSSDIPEDEMKRILLKFSGWQAWCCGFANRMPDGTIIKTIDNFHLDHIDPKSNQGSNQIVNRAPLCPAHNSRKKDREITLKRLREEIEQANELKVNSRDDLVDLVEAREYSMAAFREWPV